MTHQNSLSSLQRFDLATRDALVLAAYCLSDRPLTDREAMERLGFTDPNTTRPAVTRLIDRALLYEVRNVRCAVTGATVRACAPTSLARPEPRQMDLTEILA